MSRTVCGEIHPELLGRVLSHEHIITVHPGIHQMMGDRHYNRTQLVETASAYLALLKNKMGLGTIVDCTPPDLGRDLSLLKEISSCSGVHIIASTGFYYTEDPILSCMSQEALELAMMTDVNKGCIGVIKAAVESNYVTPLNRKLLYAAANVQLKTGLPIVVHTNSVYQNGVEVLNFLLSCGLAPEAITISHVSDSEDVDYLTKLAKSGCYLGYDRLYGDYSKEYIERKVRMLMILYEFGFGHQILLSHDAQFYCEFVKQPALVSTPRMGYAFTHILPALRNAGMDAKTVNSMVQENVKRKLLCRKREEN